MTVEADFSARDATPKREDFQQLRHGALEEA